MTDLLLDPLIWLIVLPLAWATLAFMLGTGRGVIPALVGLVLQVCCAVLLAIDIANQGSRTHVVGGWEAPLGILLVADGLSAIMLLLTQAVALLIAVYARSYFRQGENPWFWPLTGFLLAGMNALFLSGDLFNLYVTLELVGLSAVGLVAGGGKAAQVAAALRYLLASLVGSGAYLLGVALLYGTYGTISAAQLAQLITPSAPLAVGLAAILMFTGLALKTALFPLHYWLPPAHGDSPAPVSALLSALVVKSSFYLFLRLWIGPFFLYSQQAAWIPALFGSIAIFWGSWMAIRADRLKMLVAYSTVAQLGYLFLIFPLLGTGNMALQAGILQLTSHGFAKGAMFLAAGTLIKLGGNERVLGASHAAHLLPVSLFAFALAGVTLIGLPPSGGFLAKLLLIDAALAAGQVWIALVAIIGGLLASVYVFRVLRLAFREQIEGDDHPPLRASALTEWVAFTLALLSILLGLFAMPLFTLLEGVAG